MHMPKLITFTLLAAITLFAKNAVVPPIDQDNGIAVKGTDVVAYFTDAKPEKGLPEFSYKWMGTTWQFANANHLELFKANPEKYAPQYGGYCAYAVSKNETASITPKNWKIVDGKLYLNHLFAQTPWEKNIPENIQKGDKNWPGIPKTSASK